MRYSELKGKKGKQGMRGKLKSEAIKSEALISWKFHLKNIPVHTAYVNKKS
jgi:putative heme iron utilization protein